MIVGVATVTIVLSTRIMKNPATMAHSDRQALEGTADSGWFMVLLRSRADYLG